MHLSAMVRFDHLSEHGL